MIIKYIKHSFDTRLLKEDLRKLGVNFVTAGIARVFINHLTGLSLFSVLWTSFGITLAGVIFLTSGLKRSK